ncbi:MAG TPA: FAD-binding oxidoreductase [Gemmatimonadaceae bacterium]|nr:FAD-binding oxidoreductase [Gemmatimonadaceae bacterium]
MPNAAAPFIIAGFRGVVRDDADARGAYAEAAGIQRRVPLAVAVPADVEDVVALVRWAAATRTPLVPRGSGSSMAGGAVGEGVVVDLTRLTTIGEVDTALLRVHVGPGVVLGALNAALAPAGLRFPVDPSSWSFCTLGGMASTNAAGARTVAVGPTRPWVTALDCVFADGSRAFVRRGDPPPNVPPVARFLAAAPALRRREGERPARHPGVRKESSGYAIAEWARGGENGEDLVDLLVGSEGTLAIFVGLELALQPIPAASASLLAAFPSLETAVDAAAAARIAGASACELLDKTFLDVAAAGPLPVEIPSGTEAVVIAEAEAESSPAARAIVASIVTACERAGASAVRVAETIDAEKQLWALRHAASPILAKLDPALKSMQFIEDGAVPPPRLAEYVRGVRAALARQEIRGVIFGHAGDAHIHVNPLVDVRRPDWRARVDALLAEVTALVASLGGTLSGEHGDGRLRAPLLEVVWGREIVERFALVKQAFDPEGILNPGAKIARPGDGGVGDVKYDPALSPLSPNAQRALAHVERARAYSAFRLDLLNE